MMDFMTFIFGSGIIGLLFQISRDLGAIKTSFVHIKDTLTDHGARISKLEETVNEGMA